MSRFDDYGADLVTADVWPVECAWCAAEGTTTVLYYARIEHSHGICSDHASALLAPLRARKETR